LGAKGGFEPDLTDAAQSVHGSFDWPAKKRVEIKPSFAKGLSHEEIQRFECTPCSCQERPVLTGRSLEEVILRIPASFAGRSQRQVKLDQRSFFVLHRSRV
jgi:hypothetical protein